LAPIQTEVIFTKQGWVSTSVHRLEERYALKLPQLPPECIHRDARTCEASVGSSSSCQPHWESWPWLGSLHQIVMAAMGSPKAVAVPLDESGRQ